MYGPVYIMLAVMMSIVTGAFGHVSVGTQHSKLSLKSTTSSKLVSEFRSD